MVITDKMHPYTFFYESEWHIYIMHLDLPLLFVHFITYFNSFSFQKTVGGDEKLKSYLMLSVLNLFCFTMFGIIAVYHSVQV